jgi:WD40 repeat protein
MARATSLTTTTLFVLFLCGSDIARGESRSPQTQLKTYALPNNTNSADFSPDEELVVTASDKKNDEADSAKKPFLSLIQIWNIKEQKLIAELAQPANRDHRVHVRFALDGKTVVALFDGAVHVLRVSDLDEFSSFPLAYPVDMERTSRLGPVEKPYVKGMELSPNGEFVAILWLSQSQLDGKIQIYNLASGRDTVAWDTPQGWVSFTRGFVWNPDCKSILMAIPNETPCASPGKSADVFSFDANSGAVTKTLATGMLAGSIAVTSDQRVLAVELGCLGTFKNRDPHLEVFDLKTRKRLRDISGPAGVRYIVSASAEGNRFLAFTGKMTRTFSWSDGVRYDAVVDEKFTVWNLNTYEEIVTSQNIPGLKASDIRLSPKGKYAVSYGKASFVYELP